MAILNRRFYLMSSRECAGERGNAEIAEGGYGTGFGAGSEVDDFEIGIGDDAGEVVRGADACVVQTGGADEELVFKIGSGYGDAALSQAVS